MGRECARPGTIQNRLVATPGGEGQVVHVRAEENWSRQATFAAGAGQGHLQDSLPGECVPHCVPRVRDFWRRHLRVAAVDVDAGAIGQKHAGRAGVRETRQRFADRVDQRQCRLRVRVHVVPAPGRGASVLRFESEQWIHVAPPAHGVNGRRVTWRAGTDANSETGASRERRQPAVGPAGDSPDVTGVHRARRRSASSMTASPFNLMSPSPPRMHRALCRALGGRRQCRDVPCGRGPKCEPGTDTSEAGARSPAMRSAREVARPHRR